MANSARDAPSLHEIVENLISRTLSYEMLHRRRLSSTCIASLTRFLSDHAECERCRWIELHVVGVRSERYISPDQYELGKCMAARIHALFRQLMDQPAEQREAWIDSACAGDSAIAEELRELLKIDATTSGILDESIEAIASDLHLSTGDEFSDRVGSRI